MSGDDDMEESGIMDNSTPLGPEVWSMVRRVIKARTNKAEFDKWIAPLRFVAEVDGSVLIVARTKFDLDRVDSEYRRDIMSAWKRIDALGRSVKLQCWETAPEDVRNLVDYPWAEDVTVMDKADAVVMDAAAPGNEVGFGPSVMRFETLVTGESNGIAAQIAQDLARGARVPASVIFINGRQGVGKTHIMKALEAELETMKGRSVAYISAEEFYVAYVEGVMNGDTRDLKNRVRKADIVLFDDLQIIAGKKGANAELAGTIRTVSERGGVVVVTADAAPGELKGLSAPVMTVLKGAACIEVAMPDDEMRAEIVRQRVRILGSERSNFRLDETLIEHIVRRVRGPGRDLCGIVLSIYAETRFGSIAPTQELVDRVISRQQGKEKAVTLSAIKQAVCAVFEVTKTDLEGKRKFQKLVRARQIGMYLSRELTSKSFPQIGISFGGRHHTTVLYAMRKVDKALPADLEIANDVARVKRELSSVMHG
jgi:chromosomal replication initiator protein